MRLAQHATRQKSDRAEEEEKGKLDWHHLVGELRNVDPYAAYARVHSGFACRALQFADNSN